MPGRQSHGNAPAKKPRVKNDSKKRALNAYSIAEHENPDLVKVRRHRLGEQEGGNRPNKRRRNENEDNEEDSEEEEESSRKPKPAKKGRFDELDLDEGSDSEGNEWKMGQVDDDDDSDIDSDEAFGESDEERFDGFAFSGSSEKKSKKKSSNPNSMNLDEDDVEDSDSELEEGDLGEGAVDLATMLDMAEEEEREEKAKSQKRKKDTPDSEEEDSESEESDDASSISSADDDDEMADPEKIAALGNMIANLPQTDGSRRATKHRTEGEGDDSTLLAPARPSLDDLVGARDSLDKKSLKAVEKLVGKKAKDQLAVPLAKRQQDKLDRSAAFDKSKETLDRWTDTVKHNRRADHLMFPLVDNEMASAHANKQLVPTNLSKPFSELEATIQSILEESGLATANGKDDEDKIREFEELEAKKLSMDEVKARRIQLRQARELLFREEAKSKRIKKIKSKSYRKVHRKQREKEERLNQEALEEGGYIPSEDELEAQDRRRAEERMGAKHRGSKWAKAMKGTGRAAWDEDARSGINEMARRDEELRKRVEGRAVRKEFDDGSDGPEEYSEDDSSENDESAERGRLLGKLGKLGDDSGLIDESLPGAKLANMDFMRKADANRRKTNDAMVEDIRRELAGEASASEEEVGDIGRRIFGPGSAAAVKIAPNPANEFEEPNGSDEEGGFLKEKEAPKETQKSLKKKESNRAKARSDSASNAFAVQQTDSTEGGAWSKVTKSSVVNEAEANRRRHRKNDAIDVEELDLSQAAVLATQPKSKKLKDKLVSQNSNKATGTLEVDSDSEDSEDDTLKLPFAIRDQDLIKRAFAGADVVGEFEQEKDDITKDQDEKLVDTSLPGWGSWVGDGLMGKPSKNYRGKLTKKIEGVKADKRKDSKLKNVIINEKRIKKNDSYRAKQLPHGFETKLQYERSLRLPIGPEFTTKETFQDVTKPRVLIKQGIIAPMSKPLL